MTGSAQLMCPKCGAALPRHSVGEQAVCPLCGAQLRVELTAVPIAPATAPPACPLCGDVDCIEKVSSIYASEISRGYYSLPCRQTELGQLLRPPTEDRICRSERDSLAELWRIHVRPEPVVERLLLCW